MDYSKQYMKKKKAIKLQHLPNKQKSQKETLWEPITGRWGVQRIYKRTSYWLTMVSYNRMQKWKSYFRLLMVMVMTFRDLTVTVSCFVSFELNCRNRNHPQQEIPELLVDATNWQRRNAISQIQDTWILNSRFTGE